jgi:hypothetical protein
VAAVGSVALDANADVAEQAKRGDISSPVCTTLQRAGVAP